MNEPMDEFPKKGAELQAQVAVVTGGARGIGAAIAEELAALGAHVFLTARNESLLTAVKAKIEAAGGKATVAICDLADEAAITKLASKVQEEQGRCDVLVNCAGVATTGTPLHELATAKWDAMMNVNLKAPYLLIRALAPLMIAAKYGHIVNISSLAGKNPLPNGAAYSASKWALNGLTYAVAEELRQYNIRVSVVAPGSVSPSSAARRLMPKKLRGRSSRQMSHGWWPCW